jgi:hypothetical protein
MTPKDTTIDYKVRSLLHLHSNFGYNSLGFTCIYHYLNVGTNVSQSASPSKLNFWFIGSPIVLHWEGHNSSIRSVIEVNGHSMESLFNKISNRSSAPTTPTSAPARRWRGHGVRALQPAVARQAEGVRHEPLMPRARPLPCCAGAHGAVSPVAVDETVLMVQRHQWRSMRL